jgi:flagellar motor switch protein FliN
MTPPSDDLIQPAANKARVALVDHVNVVLETYLGSADMTIADLNALQADSLVELDANLNAPVELRVNGVTIAHGELVAVGDKFGVRITALSP